VSLLEKTCSAVVPVDLEVMEEVQAHLDRKTKPRGSLGLLEEVACRAAAAYHTACPALPAKAV
jgi:nicotinate-nucleotide--dimethylbenzimidazole phosphoribosyltransferase